MKIVIITAVRDEGKYISYTIESMLAQTLQPIKWIIVNDGSIDNTEEIIFKYKYKIPFLEYVALPNRGFRKPALGVIESFYEGYNRAQNLDFDIIVKLDADLKFPPDTLKRISTAFENDPTLGITGATRYEQNNGTGRYKKVLLPKGFVGGPTKFYRKQCFQDIGGLIPRAGWDGVDTIRANMKNWKTRELEYLNIYHLKPTGTAKGEGLVKACKKYGDVSYYMGGYFWYFLLRVLGRSIYARNLKVGYFMLKGYLDSKKNMVARESVEFREYMKKIQTERTKYWISKLFRFFR